MVKQIVSFYLNNQYYGIDIQDVSEIIHTQEVTELPNTTNNVEGIINLRGNICTILNGRSLLGFDKSTEKTNEKIIVLSFAPVGIIVDEVNEIVEITDENLRMLEGVGELESLNFLDSLVEINNKIITILNIKSMVEIKKSEDVAVKVEVNL